MWLTHSRGDPWGWIHTDAAIVFCAIVLLHLGMYLPEALRAALGDTSHREQTSPERPAQRTRRLGVVGAAVLAGLLLALVTFGFSQVPARPHEATLHQGALTSAYPGSMIVPPR